MITIEKVVKVSPEKAWDTWTKPEHIVNWNTATDGWTTPFAENDLKVGGIFRTAFGSPDGKNDFVFSGVYTRIEEGFMIGYTMEDGRTAVVTFEEVEGGTKITETFAAEKMNSIEMQREGWQSILENFAKYAEGLK